MARTSLQKKGTGIPRAPFNKMRCYAERYFAACNALQNSSLKADSGTVQAVKVEVESNFPFDNQVAIKDEVDSSYQCVDQGNFPFDNQVAIKDEADSSYQCVDQGVVKDEFENKSTTSADWGVFLKDEANLEALETDHKDWLVKHEPQGAYVEMASRKESLRIEFKNWLMTFKHPKKDYFMLRYPDDVWIAFFAIHLRPNMTICCGVRNQSTVGEFCPVIHEFSRLFGQHMDFFRLYKIHHDGHKIVVQPCESEEEMEGYGFKLCCRSLLRPLPFLARNAYKKYI